MIDGYVAEGDFYEKNYSALLPSSNYCTMRWGRWGDGCVDGYCLVTYSKYVRTYSTLPAKCQMLFRLPAAAHRLVLDEPETTDKVR